MNKCFNEFKHGLVERWLSGDCPFWAINYQFCIIPSLIKPVAIPKCNSCKKMNCQLEFCDCECHYEYKYGKEICIALQNSSDS